MSDPRYDEFWTSELQALTEVMSALGMDAMLMGSAVGVSMLPSDIASLIDWDIFNESALAFLNFYQLNNIIDIHQTTKDFVVQEIERFITEGMSMQDLLARLDAFTFSDARIRMIAVTEITRIYAAGNVITWQSTGYITGKRWMTAVDENVCPLCGPLHNKVVEIDMPFMLSDAELSPELEKRAFAGEEFMWATPPAHPNCRCWLQPFVDDSKVMKQIEEILG